MSEGQQQPIPAASQFHQATTTPLKTGGLLNPNANNAGTSQFHNAINNSAARQQSSVFTPASAAQFPSTTSVGSAAPQFLSTAKAQQFIVQSPQPPAKDANNLLGTGGGGPLSQMGSDMIPMQFATNTMNQPNMNQQNNIMMGGAAKGQFGNNSTSQFGNNSTNQFGNNSTNINGVNNGNTMMGGNITNSVMQSGGAATSSSFLLRAATPAQMQRNPFASPTLFAANDVKDNGPNHEAGQRVDNNGNNQPLYNVTSKTGGLSLRIKL